MTIDHQLLAAGIDLGYGERKVVDFKEGESVDREFIADLLRRTTGQVA